MIRCPKCQITGNVIEFASSPMNVVQRHYMFCDHDWVLSWQQFEAECAPSNNEMKLTRSGSDGSEVEPSDAPELYRQTCDGQLISTVRPDYRRGCRTMTQLNRVFTETIEHWNISAARLSKNMAEMPEHGLYAVWMKGELRDLLSTYDRLAALQEAGAVRRDLRGAPSDTATANGNALTRENAELREWIIEASSAFRDDGGQDTLAEAAGLVRMCHMGAEALTAMSNQP